MARDRRRVVLQSGPKLDIRKLPLKANTTFWTSWRYSTGLEVGIRVTLGHRWGSMTLEHAQRRQEIHLEAQPRHFGGCQWYALCPRTGRRALTLWMPPGSPIFASRWAWPHQVAYATQFEDPVGRAWSAKRRVVRRLGSRDPNDYELRRRPKGMRRRTYAKLTERYWAAEAALDDHLFQFMNRLVRRYGPIDLGLKTRT